MNEKKQAEKITHSNYEILRRLPTDGESVARMCDALTADFAEKHLIEPEDSKTQRICLRTRTHKISHAQRLITPETDRILSQTAEDLDITVSQLTTLLVFLHNPNISWTPKKRSPNKQTPKSTPKTKGKTK